MNKWIKKDDQVYVLTGNDKGKTGSVIRRKKDLVIVQEVNVRKKHLKKQQNAQSSQIVSIERPVHISNVALCNKDGKKIKLKKKTNKNSIDLVYEEDGKEIVHRTLKKIKK